MSTLPRFFYDRDTVQVARELIGKELIHREEGIHRIARIIETEAYLGMVDPASHLYPNGFTPRTEGTWGKPGKAYVFSMHGHACLNAITLSRWPYGCVLIRGVEQDGMSIKGPGRVTKALSINLDHNGKDFTRDCLKVHCGAAPDELECLPRVGVTKAKDMLLRFIVEAP